MSYTEQNSRSKELTDCEAELSALYRELADLRSQGPVGLVDLHIRQKISVLENRKKRLKQQLGYKTHGNPPVCCSKRDCANLKSQEEAAEKGDINAMYHLGTMYEEGDPEKNLPKAAEWYRKAFMQGHIKAKIKLIGVCEQIGKDFYALGRYSDAIQWYKEGLEYSSGNSTINSLLGCAYDKRNSAEDRKNALRCFKRAAASGNAVALCNIGVHYANGWAVEKDIAKASEYYNMAIKAGYKKAEEKLKKMQLKEAKAKEEERIERMQLQEAQAKKEEEERLKTIQLQESGNCTDTVQTDSDFAKWVNMQEAKKAKEEELKRMQLQEAQAKKVEEERVERMQRQDTQAKKVEAERLKRMQQLQEAQAKKEEEERVERMQRQESINLKDTMPTDADLAKLVSMQSAIVALKEENEMHKAALEKLLGETIMALKEENEMLKAALEKLLGEPIFSSKKATPKPAKKTAKTVAVAGGPKVAETVANTAKNAEYEAINALVRVRDSWVSARKNEGDTHIITFAGKACGWYNAAKKVLCVGESALAQCPCLGKIAAQFVREQPWFEGFGGSDNCQAPLMDC